MRKSTQLTVTAIVAVILGMAGFADAKSGYVGDFESAYAAAAGSRIASCTLCHTASIPARNAYGAAWGNAGRSFAAIDGDDTDGDGFTNLEEIVALTFPANPADVPAQTGDTTPPTVDEFDLPAESASLTVDILAFSGSDNLGVTGYRLTLNATKPSPTGAGWTASAPATHTFAAAGSQALWAWVKDAAGNVSTTGLTDTVLITAPPPPTGTLLFSDFTGATLAGDPDWERTLGRFGGVQGAFVALNAGRNVALTDAAIPGLSPYAGGRIQTKVRFVDPFPTSRADVLFDYVDAQNFRFVRLDRGTGRLVIGQVGTVGGEDPSMISLRVPRLFNRLDRWHRLTVDLDPGAGTVAVFVDAATTPTLTKTYTQTGIGRVGVAATNARRKVAFDGFSVSDTSVLP